MDNLEYAEWLGHNNNLYSKKDRALTPCHDCVAGFALEMRMEGRCDGHPRGVEEDHPEQGNNRSYDNQNALRINAEKRHAERQVRIGIAVAMFADGMSRKEIAAAMGVRHNTVVRYIKDAA